MQLYNALFRSEAADSLLCDSRCITQMLRVEAALALAQAENGIVKKEYADAIVDVCHLQNIDVQALTTQIPFGGNAAIPLVQQLRAKLSKKHKEAASFLHYGATSQDIVDTACILQIKEYGQWLIPQIIELEKALVFQMKTHRKTLMMGRTLLQHAKPITFGYKVSGWLAAIDRDREKLTEVLGALLKVQLGGPVGNGNLKIDAKVVASLAEILGLAPAKSWHTQRGMLSEWAASLGILSGNLGKMAKDISLLMQTEVGEVYEGEAEGKGGSSSMPHKRNPVTCTALIANAHRTPHLVASILSVLPQEHERAVGGWHAEWEPLNDLMRLTAGSLEKCLGLIEGLEVDTERMRQNIELTNGLVYSENVLTALLAKTEYQAAKNILARATEQCIAEKIHLKQILKNMDTGLDQLEALFDPAQSVAHNRSALGELITEYENKL